MEKIEVRIKGKVDTGWSDWLGGLTVSHTSDGETILTGNLRDQSALLGVLNRLPDLGLQLLSVDSRKVDGIAGDNQITVPSRAK